MFRVPAASAESTLSPPPNFPPAIRALSAGLPELVGRDRSRGRLDLRTPVRCRRRHARQLGLPGRLPGQGPGHDAQLVTAGHSRGVQRHQSRSGRHDAMSSPPSPSIPSGSPATVTAQTGVTMDVLLQDLENVGLGLTAHPAPGDITIGGALAIDGHGTAIPAAGESIIPGHTYGSVSNLILSLTAVVWSPSQSQYVLQTFERSDPAIQPLLTHLGRTFVTEVTLQVGANSRLRCQSFVNVPASAPLRSPRFELSDLRQLSRNNPAGSRPSGSRSPSEPWLKVWTVSPQKAPVLAPSQRRPTTMSSPMSSRRRCRISSKRSWPATSPSRPPSAKPSSPSSRPDSSAP